MSPTGEMVVVVNGDGAVLFVDYKNLQSSKAYSAAALDENFVRSERIRKAIELVQSSDQLTAEERVMALRKLQSNSVAKVIMAGAEESSVKGGGPKLRKKGIGVPPKSNLGKSLAFISLVSIVMDDDSAQAAVTDLTWGRCTVRCVRQRVLVGSGRYAPQRLPIPLLQRELSTLAAQPRSRERVIGDEIWLRCSNFAGPLKDVTLDDTIYVWDAKYRKEGGRYPCSGPSSSKIGQWLAEVRDAINRVKDKAIREKILRALERGKIRGELFRWP